jgi:ribosomal-protein-alanine N-acetyltransferase
MNARVVVDHVRALDGGALIAANLASIPYHEPWVYPVRDQANFLAYVESCDGRRKVGFIARERTSGGIVGVINISEIVRGAFQSAYIGYYGMAAFGGRGLMREALSQVIAIAFTDMRLHRLEANIQPGNSASLALARRVGFRKEGFSPRYLQIGGEWRDHERWALLAEDWQAAASGR